MHSEDMGSSNGLWEWLSQNCCEGWMGGWEGRRRRWEESRVWKRISLAFFSPSLPSMGGVGEEVTQGL